MRYIVLGSGSKGNCSLLEYKKDHFICIDVGFCYKTFLTVLNKYYIELDNIDYYFITHNHTDHIKMLCKVPNSKIYSYKKTISDYSYNILHKGINDFIDFKVNVIRTSHDAPFSIGFIFNIDNKEIVYITDSGKIKNHYFKQLLNKDYYILESNYDLQNHKIFQPKCLLIGIGIEEIAVSVNDSGSVSPVYNVYKINNKDYLNYTRFFLKSILWQKKAFITRKSTRREYEIDTNELLRLNLPVPVDSQFGKVCKSIEALDILIQQSTNKLKQLNRVKSYLLKNMFI